MLSVLCVSTPGRRQSAQDINGARERRCDSIAKSLDARNVPFGLFWRVRYVYFARFEMTRPIVTRSVSEVITYSPRLRFGLRSFLLVRSMDGPWRRIWAWFKTARGQALPDATSGSRQAQPDPRAVVGDATVNRPHLRSPSSSGAVVAGVPCLPVVKGQQSRLKAGLQQGAVAGVPCLPVVKGQQSRLKAGLQQGAVAGVPCLPVVKGQQSRLKAGLQQGAVAGVPCLPVVKGQQSRLKAGLQQGAVAGVPCHPVVKGQQSRLKAGLQQGAVAGRPVPPGCEGPAEPPKGGTPAGSCRGRPVSPGCEGPAEPPKGGTPAGSCRGASRVSRL